MSGILRLESLTKGNTLRQGDLTLLKYRLFDADGDKLDISGKSATVRLMKNNFTFVAYEKEGLTVAPDDTISFNINKILPGGLYHLEVIVDDKYIFPSREDEGKFNIDKSSLGADITIVETAGVEAVARKAVDLVNADPSLIIDEDKLISEIIANTSVGSIEEYYQEYRDVIKELSEEKDYHSLPEIAGARGGFDTLGSRLDETSKKIGHTNRYTKDTFNYLSDGARKAGAAVTFIADDAPKNDLTKLLPIMVEKGVPFGIAVVSEWIGKTIHSSDFVGGSETFMDVDELRYMQEKGAQILSHTATHTAMIDETVDVEREMRTSYEKLSELGFVVDGLVYPYNSYTDESISVAKEYYKYSFARHTSNLVGRMDNNKLNRYSLGAYYDIPSMSAKGHSTSSLAYYKERVDYAVANNEWLVFVLHTHTTNFPAEQQQHLRDTIDYIQSLGVDIVSPRDGFNRLGNIMQVGEFKIDSSGSLTGVHEVYKGAASKYGITGLSPLTDFEEGKVSVHRVGRGDVSLANGYPINNVFGILKTAYLDILEPYFSYQTFESLENSGFYIRYWQRYAEIWGPWISKGHNINSQQLDITDLSTSQISVKNYSLVNIKSTSGPIEVNRLTDGLNGNRITILVTSSTPVTFVHTDSYEGDSMHLKGNVNRTLGVRESITFTKIDDSWYEI